MRQKGSGVSLLKEIEASFLTLPQCFSSLRWMSSR